MSHQCWITIIALITMLKLVMPFNCNNQSICLLKSENNKTFNDQVIEAAKHYSNKSFTILVYAGDYNTTNGSTNNFINFMNVTIKKHPDNNTMPVNIMCPEFTNHTHNGIGFQNSTDIEISGLNFMKCGSITSGLYFRYTNSIIINDSSFHHNTDNGIQIQYGNNITIVNCNFYYNVGVQPDKVSDLISNKSFTRGAGLGLIFENQTNISVTINGCNFEKNFAYKDADYNSSADERPFGFIPFGIGGSIYLSLYRVKYSYIVVFNCTFNKNTAIHQGGAIVMIPFNSTDNILNISGCTFIENRVLGYFARLVHHTIKGSTCSIEKLIKKVDNYFAVGNADQNLSNYITFRNLSSPGGSGGAIAVSLYGHVERNILLVSNSHFRHNGAFSGGAISFVLRVSLANVENGINSNQAYIRKYAINCHINCCVYKHNYSQICNYMHNMHLAT